MIRFGLPTMPAELSLYSLNFIDRILIVRLAGLAEAGLYALAIKFAQAINVLARGFQLAWPPLAYSIADDDEARRAYSLIFTWFAAVCAFAVAGLWLLSRWIVDLLAAPEYFEAYEAIGLLATGISLYALYLVLVVILGRTGRTEFNLPATIAGTVVNIVLNLILIPSHGIVGAAIALVASYWSCSCSCTCSPSGSSPSPTSGGAWRCWSGSRRRPSPAVSCCCRPRGSAGSRCAPCSGWRCRRSCSRSASSAAPSARGSGRC